MYKIVRKNKFRVQSNRLCIVIKKYKKPKSMRLFFCTLSFIFFSNVFSQQQNSNYVNLPVTPEAAALAKMVNYPISYNTGVPNINIPFYEISVGNLKLPIQLDYHAGGFKINEKSTRVGLGWSLSCDLQITRSINGLDDFKSSVGYIENSLVTSHIPNNYYYNYPFYSSSTPFNFDNAYDLVMGIKDAEPDKFNYKLLNKSGSFYFQKNSSGTGYTIVAVPYDNIKITYDTSNQTFKIVDTDGTTYHFGVAGSVAYNSLTQNLDNTETVKREYTNDLVTSWKCHRVISNNKIDEITFNYIQKNKSTSVSYNDKVEYFNNPQPCNIEYPVQASNTYPLSVWTDYNDVMNGIPFYQISSPKYINYFWNKTELHIPYTNNGTVVDKTYSSQIALSKSVSAIYGISLSEITFRGGKVVFNGANQLSSIKVFDDNNIEVKSLHLFQQNQTTYIDGTPTEGTKYLDSLHLRNNTETFQRYALKYTSKFDYGNHLKGHDAWGYPNHKTRMVNQYTNDLLSIPKTTILQDKFFDPSFSSCSVYLANKEMIIGGDDNWSEVPKEEYLQQGILKQIIYPTGGIVAFDFEPNKYQRTFESSVTNSLYTQKLPQIGGGLRIRSINYLDNNNNFINQKYYRYGDLEEGTGILMTEPKQNSKPNMYHFDTESYEQQIVYLYGSKLQSPTIEPSGLGTIGAETKTTYQPASVLDYTYPGGAPIYYTKVTEYNQDLGEQTGKKVFTYYEPNHFYDGSAPFNNRVLVEGTNIPYLKTDWMMGAQKSIETYNFDLKTGFTPVHKKKFEYTRYNLTNQVKVVSVFHKKIYKVVSGNSTVSDRAIFSYNSSGELITSEYGIPIGKLLLSKEIEEFYDGSSVNTSASIFTYGKLPYLNPSKIITTNTEGNTIETEHKFAYDFDGDYDLMESENMVTQLVEEIKTNITINKELSRKKTNYEKITEGWGFFAPKTIQSSVKGQTLETDLTYSKYDQYGNSLEIKSKDNVPTSYLWGYNSLYPVAELKNVPYENISSIFTSNVTIADPSSEASLLSVLTNLRNTFNNPTQMVNTFTYKRLIGVTSMTNPNDYTMYYEYDPIGRLLNQKDNEKKIVKANKYYHSNFKISLDTSPTPYYNYPMMRTINYDCDTGLFNNYIAYGGIDLSPNPGGTNSYTESRLDTKASQEYNAFNCNGSTDEVANIEMLYYYHEYYDERYNNTHPIKMEVDLIQNNFIVATQTMKPYDMFGTIPVTTSKLVLPEGAYTLSFRMSEDVKYVLGEIIDFSITTIETSTTQYISSGDTFTFEKGKHYKITVQNFRI